MTTDCWLLSAEVVAVEVPSSALPSPARRSDSPVPAELTVPVQLSPNTTGAPQQAGPFWRLWATVSYALTIEGRSFTIHLQQQVFLSDDFRVYVSEEEQPLPPDLVPIKGHCHYRGYVEGFPSSAVTLSTCAGLRGLLQFENVSYGIEPLGYSPGFEHLVYPVSGKGTAESLLASSHLQGEMGSLKVEEMASQARGDKEYTYMGEKTNTAVQKVIQAFNLVNSMFHPLNLTILLTSMEVWTQENKISTAPVPTELHPQFVQWKLQQSTQPEHDLPMLLLYKADAHIMGATLQSAACERKNAGIVAVYKKSKTVESFSVLLTQLLGHSLGIRYHGDHDCHCQGHICIMSPTALYKRGTKAFSNCSIHDFEVFLKQKGSSCLFSTGSLARPSSSIAKCGNGVVEAGEQCDCGAGEACSKDQCCAKNCRFKPGVKCSSGLCCSGCQFKQQNSPCRPAVDPECDLPEVCAGSSASCPPDLYVQDGHSCGGGTGYCYKGRCQSPELQCQLLYGRGSKNAPTACYEELNSQKDRFGHCGFQPRGGYRSCAWKDLRCGKLICTYPSSTPFPSQTAAVAYVRVRQHLCVSLHHLDASADRDPLLVPPGTKCGSGKLCINNTCQPLSVLALECDSAVKCHGHGVCDNKGQCHCQPGWQPPDCSRRDSPLREGSAQEAVGGFSLLQTLKDEKVILALLGSCLLLAGAIAFGIWRCRQKLPRTEGSAAAKDTNRAEMDPNRSLDRDRSLTPEPAPWHEC
ncbi:disintegrin and metalloproteinase domain-containing protein 2-like [Pogoniulus pusillus]|uniref:disintegrin and metalloproteinase domain-containing protein 2-like n=1 Tax=Pogoniulus pusillus TaxID=488313 RepID=UPI0030B9526A